MMGVRMLGGGDKVNYVVITGASRGLGYSMAKKMINEGMHIISVSRTENTSLQLLAEEHNRKYMYYSCDLSSVDQVEQTCAQIIDFLQGQCVEKLYVVNNAGVIEPIEVVGHLSSTSVKRSLEVNVLAPMLITNAFLAWGNQTNTKVIFAAITSGAGSRPMHGWSAYCSTKAALNMFIKTTSIEIEHQQLFHKIVGLSPGIMDTDMQTKIRASTKEAFADVELFRQYKNEGMLRQTDEVAGAFVRLLVEETFGNGAIYHVNQLLQ